MPDMLLTARLVAMRQAKMNFKDITVSGNKMDLLREVTMKMPPQKPQEAPTTKPSKMAIGTCQSYQLEAKQLLVLMPCRLLD